MMFNGNVLSSPSRKSPAKSTINSTPHTPPPLQVSNLTNDVEEKKKTKLSQSLQLEITVRKWISEVLDNSSVNDMSIQFSQMFKSGVLLCQLVNKIKPGVVKKINESTVSFKQLENIENFLKACSAIGMQAVNLFNSIDLFEDKDISLVITTLAVLGKYASRVEGYTGPHLAGEKKTVKITTTPSPPLFLNGKDSNSNGGGHTVRFSNTTTGGNGLDVKSNNNLNAKKTKWRKSVKPPSVTPLNLDLSTKEAFKYSPELEQAAKDWIELLIVEKFPYPSFRTSLKDGVILCKVINKIKKGTIHYINTGKSSFKQMENIANYLTGCSTLGLKPTDLFDIPDLYEEKNINLVISNIHVLANHVHKTIGGSAIPLIKSPESNGSGNHNKLYASLVHSRFGACSSSSSGEAAPDDLPELMTWMNSHLKNRGMECKDISWDLKSGVLLLTLLEEISSLRVGIFSKDPILPWHFMQNIFLLLNFMRENSTFNVGTISAHDIFNGNVVSLCNLIRLIRENFDRDHYFKSVPIDTRRQKVIEEMVSTEQAYVKSLSVVFHTLIVQLQVLSEANSGTAELSQISQDDIFSVFGNWEKILRAHIVLQREFEDRLSHWNDDSTFGDIFLQKCGFLKDTYTDYINNYDNSYQRIKRLRKANRVFDESVNNFEVIQDSTNGLDLASYLIMPIQRIPRYLLLLKEVLKYTPNTHTDYEHLLKAKETIRQVADHVNESKMLFDNTRKIQSIQESISDIPFNLNEKQDRRYIREGFLEIDEAFNKNAYFFLFNDILLYVKYKPNEDTGKEFKFKEVFQMSDVIDISDILSDDEDEDDDPPHQREIFRGRQQQPQKKPKFEIETTDFALILIAESEMEKRAWMEDIRSCIQSNLIEDEDQLSDLSLDASDEFDPVDDDFEANESQHNNNNDNNNNDNSNSLDNSILSKIDDILIQNGLESPTLSSSSSDSDMELGKFKSSTPGTFHYIAKH